MKKVILGLIAVSAMAASAATARLGSATLQSDEKSTTIDVRSKAVVSSVSLKVGGEAVGLSDVRVVFRTGNGFGKYVSALYHVNKLVAKGGSIALDLPDNGLPIRRIEIEGNAAGFNRDAYITAYGN